jgi:hypothetical protein
VKEVHRPFRELGTSEVALTLVSMFGLTTETHGIAQSAMASSCRRIIEEMKEAAKEAMTFEQAFWNGDGRSVPDP